MLYISLIFPFMAYTKLIKLSWIFLTIYLVKCSPPEDPIKCSSKTNFNCTITNSYGTFPDRSICKATQAVFPATEDELVSIVSNATKEKRKMKVATQFSHSIPKLVCLDDDHQDGLLISTKFLNKILKIDQENMSITVESGVTLRQLISEAGKAGLVLPYVPYWWGLTIGGLIGTGAHGSSLWGMGSSVHDYIVQLRIVTSAEVANNYAKIRTLEIDNSELNAVRVSLGVLGIISQVTLKLERMFKRSITFSQRDDSKLGEDTSTFGRQHEFADFKWYPSQRKVIYRIDDRVPTNAPGNALNDFTGFRATPSLVLAIVRTTEETQEATNDAGGKCASAKLTTSTLKLGAYGLTNNGSHMTNPGIEPDDDDMKPDKTSLVASEVNGLEPLHNATEYRLVIESQELEMAIAAGNYNKSKTWLWSQQQQPFQMCLACKCCMSAMETEPNNCTSLPCCFVIDCQLPNKVCAFVPKTCNCTSCATPLL